MKLSIVIRTLNEAKHLPALLDAILTQDLGDHLLEVVVVDSGSTDGTIDIATQRGCRLAHIRKQEFSFGRSLNIGCREATGDALVFISGHCVPVSSHWLRKLVAPLGTDGIVYSYGGQRGGATTHFSEHQIFAKYFPSASKVPQEGFFCNNANSALLRTTWLDHPFDESLTGLEDMYLAKRLVSMGHKVAYIADADVFHLHEESWRQVKRRFEREAIALQHIMPEVHVGLLDVARYAMSAILLDLGAALQDHRFRSVVRQIVAYRTCQFWGAYRGNQVHRSLSRAAKERFYFPR